MYLLNKLSKKNSIFTNDAGSNYYVGGQVWYFEKQTYSKKAHSIADHQPKNVETQTHGNNCFNQARNVP